MPLNFKNYSIYSSTFPILTREEIESVFNQVEIVFDTVADIVAPDTGPVFDSESESNNTTSRRTGWGLSREQLDAAVESMGMLDIIRDGFNWIDEWRGNQEALNAGIQLGLDNIDKIVEPFLEQLTTNPDFLIQDIIENSGIIWEDGRDISEQFGPIIENFYGVTADVYILSEQFSYDLMNNVVDTLDSNTLGIFDSLSEVAQQNYISQITNMYIDLFLGQQASQAPDVINNLVTNISSFIVNSYNSSNMGSSSRLSNLLFDINSYATNINASNSLLDLQVGSNLVSGINNITNTLAQMAGSSIDVQMGNNLSLVNEMFNNIQASTNSIVNLNIATSNVVGLNPVSNAIRSVRVSSAYTNTTNTNALRNFRR